MPRKCVWSTAIAFAALVAPAAAAEAPVVPPSNSAANQYTEAFPTPGGDRKTDHSGRRPPRRVLGPGKARELEARGPDGRTLAAVTAATAPATVEAGGAPTDVADRGAAAQGGTGGGGGPTSGPQDEPGGDGGGEASRTVAQPAGSSGAGEVLGQATGLSSAGQSAALLPLVLIATVLWAVAYLFRQRRRIG